jgi:2-polyprenyl-3-methyl-5-hydroxy-6-metoxy-1,4-benzoquinol methylase
LKDYKTVVAERYDKQTRADFNAKSALNWMSSQIWLCQKLYKVLRRLDGLGHNLSKARILEVGCGGGRWTRFIAEITMEPRNIKGTDLSGPRIEIARKMNTAIAYEVADVVETPIDREYDIILAYDVFMHFRTREQIQKALQNIHNSLSERGAFIFFDAWAQTHFKSSLDAESAGFNPEEIVNLASIVGFTPIFKENVFRIFPGGRHSEQYYGHVPTWLIRLLETMSPTPPGNYFIVFRRRESEVK